MFEIDLTRSFSAAHRLRGYRGECAALHGHNWTVQAVLRVKKLDEIGIAVDFKQLKRDLDAILAEFDHTNLSDCPAFKELNPTSEAIARTIYELLSSRINTANIRLHRVRVCESPHSGATYFAD
ncbi:MAG: 6-carboxytetrahydropterin synthase QueD [Victivallaceae bacterium]|nr:6-carboxytetrahydropterin synthase QueD [Victivallaceae bacterium]